jgi:UPF0176 protein
MGESCRIAVKPVLVRTFYRFTKIEVDRLKPIQEHLTKLGVEFEIRGSLLLSEEGCNATISGAPEMVEQFFTRLQDIFPGLTGQDSFTDVSPFERWKVPLKKQIVQALDPTLKPVANHSDQTTPQKWNEVRNLVRQGRAQMIDVRNRYEVRIGTFPEAIDPDTNTFKEFSGFLDREVGRRLDPDLPTAIFCTGGIRCEKARVDLERRGFREVLQLKGGILSYLKESTEEGFEGECFVFDERIAVDKNLCPSRVFELCPTCGGPSPKDGGVHDCSNGRRPL